MDQENEKNNNKNEKEINLGGVIGGQGEYSRHSESSKEAWRIIKNLGGFIKNKKQIKYILAIFLLALIAIFFVIIFSGQSRQPMSGKIPSDQLVPE